MFAVLRRNTLSGNGKLVPQTVIDPVVVAHQGRFLPPPPPWDEGEEPTPEVARFVKKYFAEGTNYALYFGGQKLGSAVVKKPVWIYCASLTASIRLEGGLQLDEDTSALALGGFEPPSQESVRRAATAEERKQVLALARSMFRRRGVPRQDLKLVRLDNLVSTDLDRDGRREFAASFTVAKIKLEPTLFLVATSGDKLAPIFTFYHQPVAPDDRRTWEFVDQLDLDGDGLDEMILLAGGYEGWDYQIYRRRQGHWHKIYSGGGGGC